MSVTVLVMVLWEAVALETAAEEATGATEATETGAAADQAAPETAQQRPAQAAAQRE